MDNQIFDVESESEEESSIGSTSSDEWNSPRGAWESFDVSHDQRPVAPGTDRDNNDLRWTRYADSQDCVETIEFDLLLTYIYLKLRTAVRHFALLYLMSIERLWIIGLSERDRKCLYNICNVDSQLTKDFISTLEIGPCNQICKKIACTCSSWIEFADTKNIISLAKALISKCWKLEQYLNIKASNIRPENEFLSSHPRRNHLFKKDFDKVDFDVAIYENGQVLFEIPNVFPENPEWRAARRRTRETPANIRRADNECNWVKLYQNLACAVFKLNYITAYSHLGCFTKIMESNSCNNGFSDTKFQQYAMDFLSYFDEYKQIEDWFKCFNLPPNFCCCQATSSQIVCLSSLCCNSRPYCVTKPSTDFSTFHINWGLHYGRLNSRFTAQHTLAGIRPKITDEVRMIYINFLLNRSNWDVTDFNIHSVMLPFEPTPAHERKFRRDMSVPNGRALTDRQRARLKFDFVNRYYPESQRNNNQPCDPSGYQHPVSKLDKFYNMIHFTNPGNILLLYQQTLNQLDPFSRKVRKFEQHQVKIALKTLKCESDQKFKIYDNVLPVWIVETLPNGNIVGHMARPASEEDSQDSE